MGNKISEKFGEVLKKILRKSQKPKCFWKIMEKIMVNFLKKKVVTWKILLNYCEKKFYENLNSFLIAGKL